MALPPSIAAEVAAIEAAHRAAQARLGIAGAYLALIEWGAVSSVSAASTAARWTAQMIRLVAALRRRSLRLAKAYYQLTRAIQTGYSLGESDHPAGNENLGLAELRAHFLDQLNEVATMETSGGDTGDGDIDWFENALADLPDDLPDNARSAGLEQIDLDSSIQEWLNVAGNVDEPVEIDPYEWPDDTPIEEIEEFMAPTLQDLVDLQEDRAERLRDDDEAEPRKVIDEIQKSHDKVGNTAAGEIQQGGASAGREAIADAISKDKRVRLVARGLGPNPCAFCSMLASRGWSYRNGASAGGTTNRVSRAGNVQDSSLFDGDGFRKYHPNCHCYPIVRFVDASELPALNQFFADNWEDVTKDYPSANYEKLNAWRRWLYHQRKNGADLLAPAQ